MDRSSAGNVETINNYIDAQIIELYEHLGGLSLQPSLGSGDDAHATTQIEDMRRSISDHLDIETPYRPYAIGGQGELSEFTSSIRVLLHAEGNYEEIGTLILDDDISGYYTFTKKFSRFCCLYVDSRVIPLDEYWNEDFVRHILWPSMNYDVEYWAEGDIIDPLSTEWMSFRQRLTYILVTERTEEGGQLPVIYTNCANVTKERPIYLRFVKDYRSLQAIIAYLLANLLKKDAIGDVDTFCARNSHHVKFLDEGDHEFNYSDDESFETFFARLSRVLIHDDYLTQWRRLTSTLDYED